MIKKTIYVILLCTLITSTMYGQIKIDSRNYLLMPDNKTIMFADKWGIEHTTRTTENNTTVCPGFNIYRNQNYNYAFMITDTANRVGIGTGNPKYGKIELLTSNNGPDYGLTFNLNGTASSFRLYVHGTNAFITRGGNNYKGLSISTHGNVSIKQPGSADKALYVYANYPENKYGVFITASLSTIDYALYVQGKTYLQQGYTSSDVRLKKNIKPLKEKAQFNDSLLPISYNYIFKTNEESYIDSTGKKYYNTELVDNVESFGFSAQDVQKYYPNLVNADQNGYLAVNYDGFIPILWQANGEMQKQIAQLEKQVQELQKLVESQNNGSTKPKLKSETIGLEVEQITVEQTTQTAISQNSPNPWNQSTVITVDIAQNVTQAMVCIYDLTGKQLKCYTVYEKGQSQIVIHAEELKPGMYLYSLITDGQLIDTKRMVLTE